jgi:hypothetical protein
VSVARRLKHLPLPPFGRELAAARRHGDTPNVHVHAGTRAWERARMRAPPGVLCLPPEAEYRHYDWAVCRGLALTLIVWDRPREFVDGFARQLVLDGAALVAALGSDREGATCTFYRPRVE